MKRYLFLIAVCLFFIIANVGNLLAIDNFSWDIWDNAGLQPSIPGIADVVINVDDYTGNDNQKVAAALDAAKINSFNGLTTIIYFSDRTYNLSETIELDISTINPLTEGCNNIIFQGAGAGTGGTELVFNFGSDSPNCFVIRGTEHNPHITTLSADVAYNSNSFSANDLSGITVNEWFRLSEWNHPVWQDDISWAKGCVGQITQLTGINGNNGTMYDRAGKDFSTSYELRLYRFTPVQNVGIENLKITRSDGGGGGSGDSGISIVFECVVNSWVKGVHSQPACKHHVKLGKCAHIEISGCYFRDAGSYDAGGHGYGVMVTGTTSNCLIENNIFKHLRHAMLIQAGANTNAFTFNYSNEQYWTWEGIHFSPCGWAAAGIPPACGGEICLHGNYPFNNCFENNYVGLIIGDGVDDGWYQDYYHGPNGPNNFFLRNMVWDDHGDGRFLVKFINTPDYMIIACITKPDRPVEIICDGNCGSPWDIFGCFNSGVDCYHHGWFGYHLTDVDDCTHYKASAYYDAKPSFLSGYSWPAIGPKLADHHSYYDISQNIPARDRFNSGNNFTYLPHPTPVPYYLSGTINENLALDGYVDITANVTISSGYTLTFEPGTIVRFYANTSLFVNGTLIAEGTSSDHITITAYTGNWSRIHFNNSSVDNDCIIKYCDIEYASYGIRCHHANPTIENNTFNHNSYAIYLYHSSPSIKSNQLTNDRLYANNSDPTLDDNYIDFSGSSNSEPLYLYQSSPDLFNNTFKGGYMTTKAYYYSSPQFGDENNYNKDGNNRIEQYDGEFALMAENHAAPFLGSSQNCAYGEENTVKGDLNNLLALVMANNNTIVEARMTWWGQHPAPSACFSADGTSFDRLRAGPGKRSRRRQQPGKIRRE